MEAEEVEEVEELNPPLSVAAQHARGRHRSDPGGGSPARSGVGRGLSGFRWAVVQRAPACRAHASVAAAKERRKPLAVRAAPPPWEREVREWERIESEREDRKDNDVDGWMR